MDKDYVRISKACPFPNMSDEFKISDEAWKNEIFRHLLLFYKNHDSKELKEKIKKENEKSKPRRIEALVAKYIRLELNKNEQFNTHFKAFGENTNDENVEGKYDITIHSTNWRCKDFYFECKNLDTNQKSVDMYVCYHKGHSVFDGGVYRYFNGKYAQKLNFGGMIGFVLAGKVTCIKNKILEKLRDKFDISPEGDFLKLTDNSIEKNEFTFDSEHTRKEKTFIIHHLLFDFT